MNRNPQIILLLLIGIVLSIIGQTAPERNRSTLELVLGLIGIASVLLAIFLMFRPTKD